VRDIETIDAELRLVSRARRVARAIGSTTSTVHIDELLDERLAQRGTITPHGLRHSAASLAVSVGANVKAVPRMLGHAKASMTLDVYADLFDDDLDGVAVSLDAAIKSTADALRTIPAH
jgi:integrase